MDVIGSRVSTFHDIHRAEGAEYWSAPGSKVSTLIAYAKSRITGDKPDVGTNDTVDL
ncbi:MULTISPECIES: pyridoxamine 5'-phosphate oxidase family protein [unclassified Rhodococcus (in: high G+C Gram-positive bacteria)]|uniref:pyridoxamine 5'-phosphate oxidase family protein n=1 Tax=unclassified Rhodococcus (in: high G+C Gram-positive bacteria) TaxID=192944 RepID=UPI001FF71A55|nr:MULTISPECIES: pyridoxamine 5'-phosphate oxidase family protein [unclassified Rhodococcus (in: high G+C Gram-positive bacteria)]